MVDEPTPLAPTGAFDGVRPVNAERFSPPVPTQGVYGPGVYGPNPYTGATATLIRRMWSWCPASPSSEPDVRASAG